MTAVRCFIWVDKIINKNDLVPCPRATMSLLVKGLVFIDAKWKFFKVFGCIWEIFKIITCVLKNLKRFKFIKNCLDKGLTFFC